MSTDRSALAGLERRTWDAEQATLWRRHVRALVATWDAREAVRATGRYPRDLDALAATLERETLTGPQPWPTDAPAAVPVPVGILEQLARTLDTLCDAAEHGEDAGAVATDAMPAMARALYAAGRGEPVEWSAL